MSLVLRDDEFVALAVVPKSAAGNVTSVESPVWASSDETVLIVTPSEDGLSATATATGKIGTAQVQFSCDAVIGEGVRELTGVLDVEVKAGEAVSVDITAGAPQKKEIPA